MVLDLNRRKRTRARLLAGAVIPALPLALAADGSFDEAAQRRLVRYYLWAGAGGLAAAVHTTQFVIRDPHYGLFEPVLRVVADEAGRWAAAHGAERPLLIAGAVGETEQAVAEARLARELGYDAVLLSPGGVTGGVTDDLIARSEAVAAELPLVGFYLQEAVGGRYLDEEYWRRLCCLPDLVAIKVACFDRYRTLDVLAAVVAAGAAERVALYTGNDDQILLDLVARYELPGPGGALCQLRFVGGLLGQWACWTTRAVEQLERARDWHRALDSGLPLDVAAVERYFVEAAAVTRANAAVFDVVYRFAGCIAGINHVLWRQGLIASDRCLEAHEVLSPGQAERIAAVVAAHPELTDDAEVTAFLAADSKAGEAAGGGEGI
ncbi:MAG: dihydrodipicolinate synthase family protein [Bacillota bacterium]|nr:dihydrodipicolinate synthase family protein [Bacillota bacterium]